MSFLYVPLAKKNGWPEREDVAVALAGYDVDQDGHADSADARIKVVTDDFMKLKDVAAHPPKLLFNSRESAIK